MNRRSNQHSNKYSTLEELYRENRNLVYVFLSDIVEDESLKDDLASAVWVKVFNRSEMFLGMNKTWVKNYIRVMVRNAASDYIKAERREREVITETMILFDRITEHSAEDTALFVDDEVYLERACSILTKEEKELIQMRFAYKMSAREVGNLLEISEDTVRVRQFRTLRKLKNEIIMLKKENE